MRSGDRCAAKFEGFRSEGSTLVGTIIDLAQKSGANPERTYGAGTKRRILSRERTRSRGRGRASRSVRFGRSKR